jgi:hypothetical protein
MDKNYKKPDAASADPLPPLHRGLLQLVQKNQIIPNFLNNLTANDPNLRCLKKAIAKGNFRSQIWNNRDCNLYLIYLIQNQLIPVWQGITAYTYLIAKMQFTETQDLRSEDQDVKFNYLVEVISLVKAKKITMHGYEYLLALQRDLKSINVNIDQNQLIAYVLRLPRIEQWLIKTEYNHHYQSTGEFPNDVNRLVWILIENLPLMQKLSGSCYEDASTPYVIPSSSLINYVLRSLNKPALRMRPVLGNLGLKTLYHWHRLGVHPVSLYAPQIVSNPKDADDFRCGPFPMWLHDIGHSFWGSMLTKVQRDSIFVTYIPALRQLKEIAKAHQDDRTVEFLNEAEIKACDFDLTAITSYAERETRFDLYLAHTIGKNPNFEICVYNGIYEYEAIGRAEGDMFYFLLHYGLCARKMPKPFKEVYRTLISLVTTGRNYREQRRINALQTLAKQAAIDPDVLFMHGPPLGNWDSMTWQRLLKSDRSSAEVWFSLTSDTDLSEELLLMVEQGLNFFHPYLPMTPSKRLALLDYFEKQATHSAKNSKDRYNNASIVSKFQPQFFKVLDHETGELSCVASDEIQTLKYN